MPSVFSADWRNEVDKELRGKAGKATTLAGYGIIDAYTRAQADAAIANVSVDFSEQLDQKVDKSDAASFLRADGSVAANKLVINSRLQGSFENGLTVQSPSDYVNFYMVSNTGYGFFLHAAYNNFYILADRNRDITWNTGNYPLLLAGDSSKGYVFGQEIATVAGLNTKLNLSGGTMTGRLTGYGVNASTAASDSSGSFEVRNVSGAGDGAVASIAFHCQGAYGIKLHLRPDGFFGWGGWSSNAWRLYQGPDGGLVSAGNVTAYSDPRLKDDVERIENALWIIHRLDGVRFTWNGRTALIGQPGKRDIGVLADQVEAVLPEIVGRSIEDAANGDERWRTVDYDKLVPVLIEAIKELTARVEALEADR
ncbi:tail fiber domain-containing protein [Mesorhizobium sp. 1B3]|uniref:tail fiber domain-containing protein n=1 Tax=Mesorhizobium sp. 1B3 TaxID=3243599 RepID=UPI003D976318